MVIGIVWLACGILTTIVASKKGQSGCMWFFVGCLLGPIALIIALVLTDNKVDEQKPTVREQAKPVELPAPGETKRCPFCAEAIQAGAVYCRFCNHWLEHAYQQGVEAMRQSNWELAAQKFLQAVERAENTAEAYYGLALAQSKQGNRQKALESLKAAAAMGHEKAAKKLRDEGVEF